MDKHRSTGVPTGGIASEEDYLFDSGSDLRAEHVGHLEAMLDPVSTQLLAETGVGPGEHCLEIGAGSGSIACWLADRVGLEGRVVATDLATEQIARHPGVEVHRSDITEELPPGGPFDLIHARIVLTHLPQREQVLTELVRALRPGGWLVLGDLTPRRPEVLAAPWPSDRELFERMQHLSMDVVSPAGGISWEWAREVPERMAHEGLEEVQAADWCRTSAGGDHVCLLHRNLNIQADAPLRAAGAAEEELVRYRELMLDQGFTAWFYQVMYTRGRRPV